MMPVTPVRILVIGWSFAALIGGAAVVSRAYWEREGRSALEECRAGDDDKSEWGQFALVCDSYVLQSTPGALVGVQKRIVQADLAAHSWQVDAMVAASFLALLCSVPFAWYFLLARIKELADAIRR